MAQLGTHAREAYIASWPASAIVYPLEMRDKGGRFFDLIGKMAYRWSMITTGAAISSALRETAAEQRVVIGLIFIPVILFLSLEAHRYRPEEIE